MSMSDDELDGLLRRLPAPGVPPETRARHLEQLRAAMAEPVDSVLPGDPIQPAEHDAGRTRPSAFVRRTAWSRRRRVVVALTATGVVLVGGTAAATLAWQRAPVRNIAHCYPFVTTDFFNPIYGPDTSDASGDSASSAIEACRGAWAQGLLRSTPPYDGLKPPVPAPPPPLVACVLPNGVVGVFPGPPSTCGRLGLATSEG